MFKQTLTQIPFDSIGFKFYRAAFFHIIILSGGHCSRHENEHAFDAIWTLIYCQRSVGLWMGTSRIKCLLSLSLPIPLSARFTLCIHNAMSLQSLQYAD